MTTRYLDWAATAPPYKDILEQATEYATALYANPSSQHGAGMAARDLLETSRKDLARVLGTTKERIIFTSGGTEADSIAMLSTMTSTAPRSIVISAIEHAAIYEQARVLKSLGTTVIMIKPDHAGFIDPAAVAAAVRPDTVLVAVMAVNNETGAIQPIKAIASAVREAAAGSGRRPFVHCDAVQALGKIPVEPELWGVDGVAFSAHKLGGPRGCGALFLGTSIRPLACGGGQESGIRPGTHNTPGAWAFAQSAIRATQMLDTSMATARHLEELLIDGVDSIPGASVIPNSRRPGDQRYSPYILSMAFPGLGGETMLRLLDEAGIAVSTGAACSGSKKERRVFDAMGIEPSLSFASLRVSIGRSTDDHDIFAFLEAASAAYARYRL
ncbi:MAG TPA: cysteine desulfurase family protein [bacterium]|nr:cysteine desulfurase family protein [bacterium]